MIHTLSRLLARLRPRSSGLAEGLFLAAVLGSLIAYGTVGFCYFEAESLEGSSLERFGTGVWWSVVTMTTVGYGDFFPQTWQGRWLVATPLMIVGIGVLGYVIGVLTAVVVERQSKRARGMIPYEKSDHVIICNAPSADLLIEIVDEVRADDRWATCELVLATDAFEELPRELEKRGLFFVQGNPCRERVLTQANLAEARAVMIAAQKPQDETCDSVTLGVLVTVRALNPSVFVVVECVQAENQAILERSGAGEVVGSGSLRAGLMVQGLQDPGVNGLVAELLTNSTGHQLYVEELKSFRGTYAELCALARAQGTCIPLGVIRDDDRQFLPDDGLQLEPGNKAMLIGSSPLTGL